MLAFSKHIADYQCMSKFQVAVFEDEPAILHVISDTLQDSPYEIGAQATTRQSALEVLQAMYAGELSIDAVLLDGNLDTLDGISFSDAHVIYTKMYKLGLTTPIIGISTDELRSQGIPIGRELDITKWGLTKKLLPTLDALELADQN
jgi:CheY-like chemotaxis protein